MLTHLPDLALRSLSRREGRDLGGGICEGSPEVLVKQLVALLVPHVLLIRTLVSSLFERLIIRRLAVNLCFRYWALWLLPQNCEIGEPFDLGRPGPCLQT